MPPLVIDLDGTLIPQDSLEESVTYLVWNNPLGLVQAIWALLNHGKAAFKDAVAQRVHFPASTIFYNQSVLDFIKQEKQHRKLILATGANQAVADAVAKHLNLFDDVIASSAVHNIARGEKKLAALQQVIGHGSTFDYIGNSHADIPMWKAAEKRYVVTPTVSTSKKFAKVVGDFSQEFRSPRISLQSLVQTIMLRTWSPNLALFLPAIVIFPPPIAMVNQLGLAFVILSLLTSATYLTQYTRALHRTSESKTRLPLITEVVGSLTVLSVSVLLTGVGLGLGALFLPTKTMLLFGVYLAVQLFCFTSTSVASVRMNYVTKLSFSLLIGCLLLRL